MRASTTLGSVVGGAIAALAFLPSAIGQDTSEIKSCVQTGYAMLKSCPCDEASFTFSLEGETRIVDNKASVLDVTIVLRIINCNRIDQSYSSPTNDTR